ncbi:hypothetical protein ACFLVR_03150 [Chloroflexota bacterium]
MTLEIYREVVAMSIFNKLTTTYHRLLGNKYKIAKRRQFNLTLNENIIDGVRAISATLELPLRVTTEHLLQTGVYHLQDILYDPQKRAKLQEHLVNVHLLGRELDEDGLITSSKMLT